MMIEKVKNYRKRIGGALILAIIVGIAGFGYQVYFQQKQQESKPAKNLFSVVRGDIEANVAATGTISAVNSVDISSRVTGLIRELRVQENDKVTAGQVLVVLDDTTLRAQVTQYKAQLANYAAVYERSKKLAAIGGESVQQLESDRTNYLVAQANYDNYAAQLGYYVIQAPIDGVVIGKPTPAGQTVAQGISTPQVIMTIADMSRMQIKVQVDETDIGKVQVGQPVSFTVDAYTDKKFSGKVTSISKSATTSSNVVYYPVYVDVDASQGLLYPTMTARVSIQVGESKNTLLVPQTAVKEEQGQKVVQVIREGNSESIPVTTGLSDDEQIEIVSGLNEGDNVVLPKVKTQTVTNKQNEGPPPPM